MSSGERNPMALPEWQAINREAALVSQIIGSGVTALGRASYGSGFGEYYTAFFALSIGIERLAKLILVADHALKHDGALPPKQIVKAYGHDIEKLMVKVEDVREDNGVTTRYPKPNDDIARAAMACLTYFADASKGRYANFEFIGNPSFDPANEPVNKWWREVVQLIFQKHYYGTDREKEVKHNAREINLMIGEFTDVFHTDETGQGMYDVRTASERTGQTKWAQIYGRYYTLVNVRWLSDVFSKLTSKAVTSKKIHALFGHSEFFNTFTVEDVYLYERKIWPLT